MVNLSSLDIIYKYKSPSKIKRKKGKTALFLAHYNESYQEKKTPCFFRGKLNEPFVIARSLLTLSKIVASNFMPISASLRDPVITAGGDKLRLEAFSSCCSVYGKVTILPDAIEGEFLQQGTTNVDFNTDMISALSQIKRDENLYFSVGKDEVLLEKSDKEVVEKKVSLPIRWIKGMATIQLFSAKMKKSLVLDKLQIQLLFKALPKGDINTDYYLSLRGRRPFLSPVKSNSSIFIGGIHRLRLAEGLISLANELTIYTLESENATAFQFHLPNVLFTMTLSKSFWRGFSGEGDSLENLVEDIPTDWIEKLDDYAKVNEEFSANETFLKEISTIDFNSITTRLASMGLLGFDLENQCYYYRKLPFKLERIETLNPRYKNALKLIQKKHYEVVDTSKEHFEAKIKGSGIFHKVVLSPNNARCTCTWYATYENGRGFCKHILATKILKNNSAKTITELLEEFGLTINQQGEK